MDNNQYLVSICVPIYGVEKYIERCAVSLFEQTYPNIEYIFVNDCTPDKSIEILKTIIERYPKRKPHVKIINHEYNRGLAAARNTAINAVNTEFLMHVDSDDWIEVKTVELIVNKIMETNSDIIAFGHFRHYKGKTLIQNPPHFKTAKDFCISLIKKEVSVGVWGKLYRTSLYIDNNVHVKEGFNMGEDYQVTPILAYYAKRITTLQIPLYHYNLMNEQSYVGSKTESKIKQDTESFYIIKSFFSDKGKEYLQSLHKTEAFLAIRHIIDSTKIHNQNQIFLYNREIIKELPSDAFRDIPFPYRIIKWIGNYNVVKLYVKIVSIIK